MNLHSYVDILINRAIELIDQYPYRDTLKDVLISHKLAVAKYIRNQLQEDIIADQLSFKEYLDPFDFDKKTNLFKKTKS